MGKVDINFMNISVFCDIQGLSQSDRFVLQKQYNNEIEKKYSEWYDIISPEFSLHPKKEFLKINKESDKIIEKSKIK